MLALDALFGNDKRHADSSKGMAHRRGGGRRALCHALIEGAKYARELIK
jgi:hypothetical protein